MAMAGVLAALVVAPLVMRLWRLPALVALTWSVAAAVPLAGLLTPLNWGGWSAPITLAPLRMGWLGEPRWLGPHELLSASEPSLNVWLFVPLGGAALVAMVAGRRVGPGLVALAVPLVGEILQGAIPALDRVGMQWPDLSANWQGLVLGALVALPLAVGTEGARGTSRAQPARIQTAATSCASRTDASISALRMETDSTLKPNGMPIRRQ